MRNAMFRSRGITILFTESTKSDSIIGIVRFWLFFPFFIQMEKHAFQLECQLHVLRSQIENLIKYSMEKNDNVESKSFFFLFSFMKLMRWMSTFMAFKLLELLTINKSFLSNYMKIFLLFFSLFHSSFSSITPHQRSKWMPNVWQERLLDLISIFRTVKWFKYFFLQSNSRTFLSSFEDEKRKKVRLLNFNDFHWIVSLISQIFIRLKRFVTRSSNDLSTSPMDFPFQQSKTINLLNWNSNDIQISCSKREWMHKMTTENRKESL